MIINNKTNLQIIYNLSITQKGYFLQKKITQKDLDDFFMIVKMSLTQQRFLL